MLDLSSSLHSLFLLSRLLLPSLGLPISSFPSSHCPAPFPSRLSSCPTHHSNYPLHTQVFILFPFFPSLFPICPTYHSNYPSYPNLDLASIIPFPPPALPFPLPSLPALLLPFTSTALSSSCLSRPPATVYQRRPSRSPAHSVRAAVSSQAYGGSTPSVSINTSARRELCPAGNTEH